MNSEQEFVNYVLRAVSIVKLPFKRVLFKVTIADSGRLLFKTSCDYYVAVYRYNRCNRSAVCKSISRVSVMHASGRAYERIRLDFNTNNVSGKITMHAHAYVYTGAG